MNEFNTVSRTTSTPQVRYDPREKVLIIAGESYPENSFAFYAPITDWIKECLIATNELHLDINISYMNSSSTKCMLDLLDLLEEAHQRGLKVSISWRYDQENPRSLDLAEEFNEDLTLPFAIIALDQ